MKPIRIKTIWLLLCLVFAPAVAHAQGVGSSGDIRGVVTDPAGAVIAKATIVAEDRKRAIRRTSVTDGNGQYEFTGLPPGTYRVTAKISGFQTEILKDVTVSVGQTLLLDIGMKISSGTEVIEVTSEPPVVEPERSHQADTVSEQFIADLPIDRRDYLTYTLLMPGVSDSTRLASDQDFRVKQTPQSGLSFYGSNGRGNSVTVDGGEANDDAGGVRLTLSQEAVQEFQINRSNYSAELGGASGAAINIVSKSGTNQFHGSLYGFFRNDAMDAADPFAISQALKPGDQFNPGVSDLQGTNIKNSLSRRQYGGTAGFPIKKDKTFLFAAFEGLRQDAQNAVPILTNTHRYQASVRLDHHLSDQNELFLRYNYTHDLEESPDVQSLTGFTRGSSIHAYDNTIRAGWFHLFSQSTQNALQAQFNYSTFNVIPNIPAEVGPDIPGFANVGAQIFLPSLTIARRPSVTDSFTMIRGSHTLKFGGEELLRGNHTESHTFFPGRFVFGNLPGGLLSPCMFPSASPTSPNPCGLISQGAFINSLQSVSLGVPQFYEQGFGNPNYNYPRNFAAFFWQDSWKIRQNFTLNYGLRYELDSQYGPLKADKDNFAPRISFAWDPF